MFFRQLFISWKFSLKIFFSKIFQPPPPPWDGLVAPLWNSNQFSSLPWNIRHDLLFIDRSLIIYGRLLLHSFSMFRPQPSLVSGGSGPHIIKCHLWLKSKPADPRQTKCQFTCRIVYNKFLIMFSLKFVLSDMSNNFLLWIKSISQ